MKADEIGEWIAIAHWHECDKMTRLGLMFEIRNADGQSLLTPCVQPLPKMPFDWTSPPVRFRAVAERKPEHSSPLPEPKG